MSALPAASHSRYWANWSVVDDGIGTMVTVLPVSASQGLTSSRITSMSLPVAPETKLTFTASAAVAQSVATVSRDGRSRERQPLKSHRISSPSVNASGESLTSFFERCDDAFPRSDNCRRGA